jgi:hypothetical protein
MSDDHQRAHVRHDLPGAVPGEVKIYHSMEIRQLSAGGALIEIGVPLQLDSLHDFRLSLGDRSVVVKARVVHSHISTVVSDRVTYQTGIEFADLSAPIALAIEGFIEALRVARP